MRVHSVFRLVAATAITAVAVGLSGCTSASVNASDASLQETTPPRSEESSELYDLLPDDVKRAGKVLVVGDVAGPWRVKQADGSVTGLTPDLLAALSDITGVDFALEIGEGLPAIKLGVQSGRYDMGFGPVLSSESSRQDLLFVDYFLGRAGLLYPAAADEISSIAGLCGKTLALIEGSAAFDSLLENLTTTCSEDGQNPAEVVTLADTSATILAVESGRADVAATSAHRAAFAVSENPDRLQVYVTSDDEFTPDPLGMIFNVADEELAIAVYEAWSALVENGTVAELMAEYDLEASYLPEPVLHVDAAE